MNIDSKEPIEIHIPDDIQGIYKRYEHTVLVTTKGNFFISDEFLYKIIKRSECKLIGQLERTRKHIIHME